jgi:predicted nucleic acid-binding protein
VSFPAFFDTCTLYGGVLNDLILRLAERSAFRPLWSADVLEELHRNLVIAGFPEDAVDRRITAMRAFFPDAMVEGYGDLIGGLSCDLKDRHVLAASIRANAEVLVTFNLKDFPRSSVEAFDIEVVHPDAFLLDQLDLFPAITMSAIETQASDYNAPPVSIHELLTWLAEAGVPQFAQEAASRFRR